MKTIIVTIMLFFTTGALAASHSSLGLSTSYFSENNPFYKTAFEPKPTITFSHLMDYKNVKIGYSTNRIDNWLTGRKKYEIEFKNGIKGLNKQEVTYDSILVGKQFNRWLPMAFVANTKIDNKLYISSHVKRKVNTVLLYGANLTYFLNKKVSASLIYIAPNKEIFLGGALSIGLNYNF